MQIFLVLFGLLVIVVIAVILLQVFGQKAGRGLKPMSNGIQAARNDKYYVPCPWCNKDIIPLTDCPFCNQTRN